MVGQLHIRVGPMCSGKTVWLNHMLTRAADTKKRCSVLRISHAKDIRKTAGMDHNNKVTSHCSQFSGISKNVNNILVDRLTDIDVQDYHVIGIDEAQFYPDLVKSIKSWVLHKNKLVYISALDVTSEGQLFGDTTKLIGISTSFQKLNAICEQCLYEREEVDQVDPLHDPPAIITDCMVKKSCSVLVGGTDIYKPTCLRHHSLRGRL